MLSPSRIISFYGRVSDTLQRLALRVQPRRGPGYISTIKTITGLPELRELFIDAEFCQSLGKPDCLVQLIKDCPRLEVLTISELAGGCGFHEAAILQLAQRYLTSIGLPRVPLRELRLQATLFPRSNLRAVNAACSKNARDALERAGIKLIIGQSKTRWVSHAASRQGLVRWPADGTAHPGVLSGSGSWMIEGPGQRIQDETLAARPPLRRCQSLG
ncbi:hypothetical protein QBC34DRAFT_406222 [Podospora aff. communis PSN243]|uniref:Uncharacterized protein n=1 Tax=Podospora aff. communis PSN243 TaxID=3040156 RepID=A0AAV9GN92_9PEZI|nr:hypothetical protein QBC34DRAFT_406222 [Podospora aff. communis PSN243]